jgi:hypothetical protein
MKPLFCAVAFVKVTYNYVLDKYNETYLLFNKMYCREHLYNDYVYKEILEPE